MDCNKKTFWMVFVILICLICALISFILSKLISLENYMKDNVYQNEVFRETYSKNLHDINDNLSKINKYFEVNKLTVK
jgi:capsular polysaccharide biosynthesis protein